MSKTKPNIYLLSVSVHEHKQPVKRYHSCLTGQQVPSSLTGQLKYLVYLSVRRDVIECMVEFLTAEAVCSVLLVLPASTYSLPSFSSRLLLLSSVAQVRLLSPLPAHSTDNYHVHALHQSHTRTWFLFNGQSSGIAPIRLLQVTPVTKSTLLGIVVAERLQDGCPSCRPTNNINNSL